MQVKNEQPIPTAEIRSTPLEDLIKGYFYAEYKK